MKFMSRRFLVAFAAVAGFCVPVMAADITEGPSTTQILDWTGKYAGFEFGYGWGRATHHVSGFSEATSNDLGGRALGVFAGYNYQFDNNIVIGIDMNAGSGNWTGGPDAMATCYCGLTNKVSASIKWDAAVRARVGQAVGPVLPYVAGGFTAAKVRGVYDYIDAFGTIDQIKSGWTLGGGVDYAFSDRVFLRAEYRYSDFGKIEDQPFLPDFDNTQSLHIRSQDVLFGISYKF